MCNEINWDSLTSIMTGYGLGYQGFIPGRDIDFSLCHHKQTNPGTHPASFPVDTVGSFPLGRVVRGGI